MKYKYSKYIIFATISMLFTFVSFITTACDNQGNNLLQKEEEINAALHEASESMAEGDPATSLEILRHVAKADPEQLSLEARNQLVRCYSNIGYILFFCYQDYVGSYEALISGQELAETLPNCKYLPELYLNLANVFGVYGDIRLAQKNYIKAYDEALYRHNWTVLLTTAYNLLSIEMSGLLEKEGKQRLDRFKKLKIPEHPMLPLVKDLHVVYTRHHDGHSSDALELLDSIRLRPYDSLTPRRISTLCDLYSLRIAREGSLQTEYAKYADRLESSLDSADTDMKATIYKRLATFYSDRGDFRRALNNHELGLAVADSTFAISNYSMLHDMHIQNKQKHHDHEMAVEREKEKILKIWIFAGLTCLAVFIISTFIITTKNRRLHVRNQELYFRYKEMQRMEEELVEYRKNMVLPSLATQVSGTPEEVINMSEIREEMPPESDSGQSEETQGDSRIPEQLAYLADRIVGILNDDAQVTCQDFSLEKLTKLAKSNRNYVSQVINSLYEKNFNSVIGEIRIKIACRRLSESASYRNMTVEALAENVGFKSRSNFVVVFKKITGLSPSDYRRTIENESIRSSNVEV